MSRSLSRRAVLLGAAALTLAACAPAPDASPPSPARRSSSASPTSSSGAPVQLDLTDLPAGTYGVWGAFGSARVAHDAQARVRLCSTMKLPLVALVARHAREGRLDLQSPLSWRPEQVVGYSPMTSADADATATLEQLCEAAARTSDNTAANLLLDSVGGLASMTEFARALGDDVTRFDRYEPLLNMRDGERDTTTAEAFGALALALPDAVGEAGMSRLRAWLPGRDERRIAASAPAGVELVHKTGSSGDGVVNDVALLWRADGTRGALAIFTESTSGSEDVVEEVARRAWAALAA